MSVDDLRKKLMDSTDPIVALKGKTVPAAGSTQRKRWSKISDRRQITQIHDRS